MFVLSREEMYFYDKYTMENFKISSRVLMETAGIGCFNYLRERFTKEKKFYIICGHGNNGGDGFVIARWLHNFDFQVEVYLLGNEKKMSPETKANYDLIKQLNIRFQKISTEGKIDLAFLKKVRNRDKNTVIVDSIFGIGFRGKIRKPYDQYFQIINSKKVPIISIDIASGIDVDNGYCPNAVQADFTLTMAKPKYGHYLEEGKVKTGKLEVIPIGIPFSSITEKPKAQLINDENVVFPKRKRNSHKGDFGKIGIIAGSKGFTGAAVLSSQSALRSGSGLVTLFVPENLNAVFESKLTEVMTFSYKNENGEAAYNQIKKRLNALDVLLIGPGIGKSKFMLDLLEIIIKEWNKKIVLDADALNLISENKDMLDCILENKNALLTPHLGEFSRLSKITIDEIQKDIVGNLEKFMRNYKCKILLKSSTSILYSKKSLLFNISGNDALATGGSGDILGGMITSFIGQGLSLKDAAISASYLIGKTAEKLSERKNSASIIPSDIIENLCW